MRDAAAGGRLQLVRDAARAAAVAGRRGQGQGGHVGLAGVIADAGGQAAGQRAHRHQVLAVTVVAVQLDAAGATAVRGAQVLVDRVAGALVEVEQILAGAQTRAGRDDAQATHEGGDGHGQCVFAHGNLLLRLVWEELVSKPGWPLTS